MDTIFELTFMDGQKRTVEAFNFSSAKVVAAYKRHTEEGCRQHTQLTVDEKKCRRVGEAPNFVFMSGSADPFNADVGDRRFVVLDAVDVSRDRLSITISEPSNDKIEGVSAAGSKTLSNAGLAPAQKGTDGTAIRKYNQR